MKKVELGLRRIDAFQQRHSAAAFGYGVVKKYGDDNAGALAAQLTYSMFITVFPLLLLLITVLNLVLAGDPSARERVASSAFGEFPIVGQQLAENIHAMHRGSIFGLVAGVFGLVYGSTGLAQTGLYAMAQVWSIPPTKRPNYVGRMGRSLMFLAVLAVGLVITTTLSGFGTFGRHNVLLGYVAEVVAALVNVALYAAAFRVLTPKQVATRRLWPGAILGGIVWTVLQALGGYVVGHDLKGASATYGMFGLVLGLLAWIYLGAKVTLYAAELNTVLARRLWPRAIVQPPLTAADQESIALQSLLSQRRPEQEVVTTFSTGPMSQDEFRRRGYEIDESRTGLSRRTTDEDAPPAAEKPGDGAADPTEASADSGG
jgi:YihY family inner membrane protein